MRNRVSLFIAILLGAGALWLPGCHSGKPQPVDIVLSEDACVACRMAVSDKKFAAEVVSPDGHVDYFDDLGCLVLRLRSKAPPPNSAVYVVDFNGGGWLEQTTAVFLWSTDLPTPMSYGLAAFASETGANAAAAQWKGEILRWSELLTRFKP